MEEAAEPIRPYDIAIVALSVFVLLALATDTFLPIPSNIRRLLEYADFSVCIVFMGDFIYRFKTAPCRRTYMKRSGWLDLISSFPTFTPLRLARIARLLKCLKILRGLRSARNLAQFLSHRRVESTVSLMMVSAFMLVVLASIAILQFEGDQPSANIRSTEDAIWWAYATVTTVGYGDRYPVTTEGRLIGAVLMIAGIGIYGVIAGSVAAWFVGNPKGAQRQDHNATTGKAPEYRWFGF